MVRDFRKKESIKMKPSYYKAPFMVSAEFKCTVYVSDLSGRIMKVSKNNLKRASPRSVEMFSKLPAEIQMVLGHPLDPDEWVKIKDTGIIPEYLEDIELYTEMDRVTRGALPKDTHLLEQDQDPMDNDTVHPGEEPDPDDDIFDQIKEGKLLDQLHELHNVQGLRPDTQLKDIPGLHKNLLVDQGNQPGQLIADINNAPDFDEYDVGEVVGSPPSSPPAVVAGHGADVHPDNILPAGEKRRVRFRLPDLQK